MPVAQPWFCPRGHQEPFDFYSQSGLIAFRVEPNPFSSVNE